MTLSKMNMCLHSLFKLVLYFNGHLSLPTDTRLKYGKRCLMILKGRVSHVPNVSEQLIYSRPLSLYH